jgi:hypothetical protein
MVLPNIYRILMVLIWYLHIYGIYNFAARNLQLCYQISTHLWYLQICYHISMDPYKIYNSLW